MKKYLLISTIIAATAVNLAMAQGKKIFSTMFPAYSWNAKAGDVVKVNGVTVFTLTAAPTGATSQQATVRLSVLAR